MRLGVVAIFRNEGPYLLEWVAHHRSIGVDHFLLYDNQSTDDSPEIFKRLSKLDWIDVREWATVEGLSPQISAYNDAKARIEGVVDFAAFIDADEFLVPTSNLTVKEVIQRVLDAKTDVGAIGLNQMVFGSNGEVERRPEPVLKRFPLRSTIWKQESRWIKSIYRVASIDRITSPHRSNLKDGYKYYNSSGEEVDRPENHPGITNVVDFSGLQINHYITKSKGEFLAKKERGGGAAATLADRLKRYENEQFFGRRSLTATEVDEPTRPFAMSIDAKIKALRASLEVVVADLPAASIDAVENGRSIRQESSTPNSRVPTQPHNPPDGVQLLRKALEKATCYLEYGSGGSTVMAASVPNVRTIISIETDRAWLAEVKATVAAKKAGMDNVHLLHGDIGPTVQWGFPVNGNRWQYYHRYCLEPWLVAQRSCVRPDLVLIDGRFRVACFLATFLFADAGTTVFFDDYSDRPYYHAIEKYGLPIGGAGRLVQFVVPANLSRDELWVDLLQAVTDVR